jgi:hypothetical protein
MPENMDESLLSAIERYKNSQETPNDRKLIRQALVSKQIIIVPGEDSKIIDQAGGADFGESNEIRVSGSVIGTQSLSGFTTEQVIELLRLYDSNKESDDDSATKEPKKKTRGNIKRRIFVLLFGMIAFCVAFLAGIYFADLVPPIKLQYPVLDTALSFIPGTGATHTPTLPTPIWTSTLIPPSTQPSTPTGRRPPTITLTPLSTYTPFPTNTQASTRTPMETLTPTQFLTNTSTPTLEVLFTDTFDDYEYSTHIGWILFNEEEGKIYRRTITRNKIDNKFEHSVDCFSQQCVERNKIPPIVEYKNFVLSFDIQYMKIPPSSTGLSKPIMCINFRRYNPSNFYALCFKSDGWYRMLRYLNGEFAIIMDWERTAVLNRGSEKNSVSLTANRDAYSFEANGSEVAEFRDNNLLDAGGIEIVVYSFQNVPNQKSDVKLEIDNIEIINIP